MKSILAWILQIAGQPFQNKQQNLHHTRDLQVVGWRYLCSLPGKGLSLVAPDMTGFQGCFSRVHYLLLRNVLWWQQQQHDLPLLLPHTLSFISRRKSPTYSAFHLLFSQNYTCSQLHTWPVFIQYSIYYCPYSSLRTKQWLYLMMGTS